MQTTNFGQLKFNNKNSHPNGKNFLVLPASFAASPLNEEYKALVKVSV